MQEVKKHALKGDIHKARIVARQIAHYRSAGDRNFERSAMINTRAQVRKRHLHKKSKINLKTINKLFSL